MDDGQRLGKTPSLPFHPLPLVSLRFARPSGTMLPFVNPLLNVMHTSVHQVSGCHAIFLVPMLR